MATKNDITGATIKTSAYSAEGRKNHDRIFSKKSAVEWAKEDNIVILDPDGFNRTFDPKNGPTMDDPISYSEYKKGIIFCTCVCFPNPKAKIKVTLVD